MNSASTWRPRKLDELGFVGRGKSRHRPRNAPELYGGPYPFFQTGDIKAADLYLTRYEQTYSDVGLAQSKLWQPGTLCITIAANIAETAILGIPGCFPDSVVGFVPHPSESDVRFVKYYIDTIKLKMQNVSKGTTQDNLSVDKLLTFNFIVPDFVTQRKIAEVLSAYDDLIENNSRRIAVLEEMAQTIYREWFVEFRFPGHEKVKLIDSPLGTIPEGWQRKQLSEIADLRLGKMLDVNKNKGNLMPYLANINVRWGEFNLENLREMRFEADELEAYGLRCGDIVMCEGGEPGRCAIWTEQLPTMMIQKAIHRIRSRQLVDFRYLYHNLRHKCRTGHLASLFTGATIKHLPREKLDIVNVEVPPNSLTGFFSKIIEPMALQVESLIKRNSILRRTRDLLLPKLLSGHLDVEGLEIDSGIITEVLVESSKKKIAVPLPSKAVPVRLPKPTPYKDDAAILCVVIHELLKANRSTSEFFVQKHAFALKHRRELALNCKFTAMAAGPWSHELKRKAIFAGQKTGWLSFNEATNALEEGRNIAAGLDYARRVLGERYAEVQGMVVDLVGFGNSGLERWMTVFKVVCDFKEKGTAVTRASIQKGIDNWKGKRAKPDFSIQMVDQTINGMVKHGWFSVE